MDQTNIPYVQEPKSTITFTGAKSVNCKTPKTKGGSRATALLAIALSGEKLPGLCVFAGVRRATVHKECRQHSKINPDLFLFTVQKKAWCDEEVMLEWIKRVWKPYINKLGAGPFLLLLDDFSVHHTVKVKMALSKLRTVVLYIPPGATSKAQPLDVGINKPFKSAVYTQQVQILITDPTIAIGRSEIATFMINAWKQTSKKSIVKTFRHIGFITLQDQQDIMEELEDDELDLAEKDDDDSEQLVQWMEQDSAQAVWDKALEQDEEEECDELEEDEANEEFWDPEEWEE